MEINEHDKDRDGFLSLTEYLGKVYTIHAYGFDSIYDKTSYVTNRTATFEEVY